jgi:hypothetical protein
MFVKDLINALADPKWFISLSTVLFFATMPRASLWSGRNAIIVFAGLTLFFILSMGDPNFALIVTKADNIPIVGMIFLCVFFLWFSMWQAKRNDEVIASGGDLKDSLESNRKVFVWPDLLYIEFICILLMTVLLVVWSIVIPAPIEEPANPTDAPNPSKAPWYFLGLQEMLVYYDPWLAGVVFPSLIILGLMALPYLDKNPKGNGYYTFKERPFAILTFNFGFLILWVLLIILGTFLRGPNWNFFGPYEYWDVGKLEPLVNVNLSELVWVKLLGGGLPKNWFLREIVGIGVVFAYFAALPPLFSKRSGFFRRLLDQMGTVRFYTMIFLFLVMVALPIKMFLRWMFNLKYIVAIPEFFFNI